MRNLSYGCPARNVPDGYRNGLFGMNGKSEKRWNNLDDKMSSTVKILDRNER